MRRAGFALLLVLALAPAVARASAAASAPLSAADRRAIGVLVDRFVKTAVRREDLAAAWQLIGPDLRGGTTRRAWIAGTGVTVPTYPAQGNDFRHAWTVDSAEPGHAELSLILHPKPGSGYDETAAKLDVRKLGGRWVVDLFYSSAEIRTGSGHRGSCGTPDCAISGPGDFGPVGSGPVYRSSRIAGHWLVAGLIAVGAAIVLSLLGIWLRLRWRDRRAWADYHARTR